MLFANDYNDNRVHIDDTFSNQEYYCPYCGAPLITKKGDQRQHHFSHKQHHLCSDSWVKNRVYDVSPWHNEWQSRFPKENQEVKLSLGDTRHRADVLIDHTVVEFQHSIMSANAFDDRNNFYFNLGCKVIWLFDLSDLYEKGQITYQKVTDGLIFSWKNPKKAFNNYDIQSGCIDLFFQIGSDKNSCIVRVTDVSLSGFEQFYTTDLMSQNDFLVYVGLRDGCCLPPSRDDLEQDVQYQQFKEKYNIRLNKQQERALQAVEGSNLLLAVPGSGKTAVLVARLGHMVLNKNIPPESILAVTYNNAAAEEMKERFAAQFGSKLAERIDFWTINSLSNRIYLDDCRKRGQFRKVLIQNQDKRNLIKQAYKDVTGEYAAENDIQELASAITYIKNMMLSKEQVIEIEVDYPQLSKMFETYQTALDWQWKMDYDDQMVFALSILRNDSETVRILQRRYRYICVDEAQDTSKIQHEIIRILAQDNNLFMVGDEDQSIYGFRAAYPRALLNFRYDYLNPYILRMERNYRSTNQIVEKAQLFISQNKGRYEKKMTAERGDGEAVDIEKVISREEQYMRLLEVAKTATSETAFLYRDNESAVVLIDLLCRNGIPFRLRKPDMHFFEISVVKDVIAYLSLAINPYDAHQLKQICNRGVLYLKEKQRDWAIRNSVNKRLSVYEAIDGQMEYIPGAYRDRAARFRAVMSRISQASSVEAISILLEAGYGNYLKEKQLDAGKVELLQILAKQEPDIRRYLFRLKELDGMMRRGFDPQNGANIVLSTIHSSKGLEYDSVYMVDVFDGRFPSVRPSIFCRSKDSSDGRQEERRLFYVGITRAKNRLHLFEIAGKPSSFIEELFPERRLLQQQEKSWRRLQFEEPVRIKAEQDCVGRERPECQKKPQESQMQPVSPLSKEFGDIQIKRYTRVDQIMGENYDQEDYLIYDRLNYRRVKCIVCGGVKPEIEIVKLETLNRGICEGCTPCDDPGETEC